MSLASATFYRRFPKIDIRNHSIFFFILFVKILIFSHTGNIILFYIFCFLVEMDSITTLPFGANRNNVHYLSMIAEQFEIGEY